jgi:hypothetical protein
LIKGTLSLHTILVGDDGDEKYTCRNRKTFVEENL